MQAEHDIYLGEPKKTLPEGLGGTTMTSVPGEIRWLNQLYATSEPVVVGNSLSVDTLAKYVNQIKENGNV